MNDRESPWVTLLEGQLREFGDSGYLVLPGVVPERLLAAVDAEIDALPMRIRRLLSGGNDDCSSGRPAW